MTNKNNKIQQWQNPLIYLLAFSSGFCIMGIELLGGRILAVFMLSLSFGYLAGGKLSTKAASLNRYGLIFICAGIAILPVAFSSEWLMEAIFLAIEDTRYGSLLASMALFFIPTVILGMISPYSVRLLVTDKNKSGQVAGFLYFVSTLGSALGTIITSFYLVLLFEVNDIIMVFSATLLVLGVSAMLFNRVNQQKTLSENDNNHQGVAHE